MTFCYHHIWLFITLSTVLTTFGKEYDPDQAKNEIKLVEYLKTKKPEFNVPSDVTHILMFLDLKQILETDEMSGLLTAKFTKYVVYKSQTSAWDPAEYKGVKVITVEPGVMWAPDISKFTS